MSAVIAGYVLMTFGLQVLHASSVFDQHYNKDGTSQNCEVTVIPAGIYITFPVFHFSCMLYWRTYKKTYILSSITVHYCPPVSGKSIL
jgi:hypothetical protein